MTIEEAVEIVLKGEAWQKCLACVNGRIEGSPLSPSVQVYDSLISAVRPAQRTRTCTLCQGTTLELRHEYMKACQILDKPLPARPHDIRFGVDAEPKARTEWKTVYFSRGQTGVIKVVAENPDE